MIWVTGVQPTHDRANDYNVLLTELCLTIWLYGCVVMIVCREIHARLPTPASSSKLATQTPQHFGFKILLTGVMVMKLMDVLCRISIRSPATVTTSYAAINRNNKEQDQKDCNQAVENVHRAPNALAYNSLRYDCHCL